MTAEEKTPPHPPAPQRLADGSAPASPEALFARLEALGIEVRTVTHERVFTVDEAKEERGHLPGCHTKNLFLRNKKGREFLLVCEQDRDVDLRALADTGLTGSGRLSFASERRLMRRLGVVPGAVNPFAVINDVENAVTVLLDRGMLQWELLNFHPLDNAMTTSIATPDFLRFLDAEAHEPVVVGLEALTD